MSQRKLEGVCGSDLCGPSGIGTSAEWVVGGAVRESKGLGMLWLFSNFRLSLPTKGGGS